ncbi:MAG: hypothetical protein HWE24_02255 [Oceanospirillaceae bacterium]|nr:hypothetical protein [Oceanospirillaceae bacterium]
MFFTEIVFVFFIYNTSNDIIVEDDAGAQVEVSSQNELIETDAMSFNGLFIEPSSLNISGPKLSE